MSKKKLRIGIVAGEASGDILAAGLIRSLKTLYPDAVFEGIAGPQMQAQGCHSLFDMDELSVMGLVEVLSRLRRLLHVRKTLLQHFLQSPPDVFIGVDAPDFNLGLEAKLKKHGVKTVHYVSPTVWAWREKRIFKIAKATNLVLGLFPFEQQVYQRYQVPYQFVGHTLADEVPLQPDRQGARTVLGLDADAKVLALLPGSRRGEVELLLEIFIQAAEKLAQKMSPLKVLLPVVNRQRKEQVEAYLKVHKPQLDIQLVIGHSREVMTAANGVLLASGTATLEAMLCKRPMVTAYKMNKMTYRIMQKLYRAKYFSLPNLLADKLIIPELLQEEVNADNLAEHLYQVMTENSDELISTFQTIHHSLKRNADQQAAAAICRVLDA